MPLFGAHLSIAGGTDKAALRARELGADCLQLFLKSPSQWRFAALSDEEVARFKAAVSGEELRRISPLIGHASYLVNLASPDDALYERSRLCLLEELDRAARLGLDALVLHPGAHMASGEQAGLDRIAAAIQWLLAERPALPVRILLETTAGAGTVLGSRFEQIAYIIGKCDPAGDGLTRDDFRLGVCIDTCHIFAAGYDIRTAAALDETLGQFDATVGLRRLCVVHANDSRGGLGSHLDRHAHIGRGKLGRAAFRLLVNHTALRHLAFIIETPKEDDDGREMDPVNLRTLRKVVEA